MKPKRIRRADDLTNNLQTSGFALMNPGQGRKVYERDNAFGVRHDDDVLEQIPSSAALQLGRPAGSRLSDDQKELLRLIIQALDEGVLNGMSKMQRNCFVDVYISGDTFEMVRQRYHITRGAVQTHILRAAAIIRKAIGPLDE